MQKKCNRIVTYDEIVEFDNLMRAYKNSRRKNSISGLDGVTPKEIDVPSKYVYQLYLDLINKKYLPKEVLEQSVLKYDGTCMICFEILCFSDRIVQNAIKNKLLPLLNEILYEGVCGYRGKKYKKRYYECIKFFWKNNYKYIVSFDIKHFFKSIDKNLLLKQLGEYCDEKVVRLIDQQLFRKTMEMPLGHILSTLLSNFYLYDIDYAMYQKFGDFVRYGDNYIFPIKENLSMSKKIENELEKQLKTKKLELNREKTMIISDYKDIGIL